MLYSEESQRDCGGGKAGASAGESSVTTEKAAGSDTREPPVGVTPGGLTEEAVFPSPPGVTG